jgi:phage shock protein C
MKKQLFRIKTGSMVFGVANGLAEYFDIDVTLVRVMLVVGIIAPMPVVLPYLILAIAMPVKESQLFVG